MTLELTDRQREIIDVSLELIAESGIQGLTIKNLAKRIGFSESAIYRHYENKIQILVAILNYFRENTKCIFTADLATEGNAVAKINHLLATQFEIFATSPSLMAVIFSEELFRNEPILMENVSDIMSTNFDTLTNIIKTGQEKGEIRTDIEADHLSVVIMGSLRLFVKQWHMSNYAFNLIQEGNELTASIKVLVQN